MSRGISAWLVLAQVSLTLGPSLHLGSVWSSVVVISHCASCEPQGRLPLFRVPGAEAQPALTLLDPPL